MPTKFSPSAAKLGLKREREFLGITHHKEEGHTLTQTVLFKRARGL